MKSLRAVLLGLLCGCAVAAPKTSVTLGWDAPSPSDMVEVYRLYISTEFNPGADWSLFYADTTSSYYPDPTGKGTVWLMTHEFKADVTQVTIPVTWSWSSPVFFSLTASNRVGESEMSNVAWLPAIPLKQTLRVDEVR